MKRTERIIRGTGAGVAVGGVIFLVGLVPMFLTLVPGWENSSILGNSVEVCFIGGGIVAGAAFVAFCVVLIIEQVLKGILWWRSRHRNIITYGWVITPPCTALPPSDRDGEGD